jgi:hypothetical protein
MEPCVSIQHSPQLLQLSAAVEQVLAADPRDVADSHRLGELEQMLTIHNQLDAAINQRLQVVDVDETTVAETGRATRSWLIEEQHINPSEATKRMRVARALPTHPAVDKASAAGEISLEHANAICRATAAVSPEFREIVESTLVDIARHCAPCDLGDEIEQLLIACGAESSSDEAHTKRLNRRGLRIARTFNGMRSVSGMLTPEVAAALEIALGVLSAKAGDDDARSHEQRQHDAVGELANHYLAHADLPAVNGERPRIVVTIDYDSLVTGLRDAWGQLPSGATISPATARRLACNAEVIPAVLNARGDVLDLGVASRTFSTVVRRAAWLEQQGRCAFPRCRRPPADCHHIVWWSHGGLSTLDNAAWLCAFHHWLVHEGSWTLRRDPDRSFLFTGPDGQERRRPRDP